MGVYTPRETTVFIELNVSTADAINELNEREIYDLKDIGEVIRVRDGNHSEGVDVTPTSDIQAIDIFTGMPSIVSGLDKNGFDNYGQLIHDHSGTLYENIGLDSGGIIYSIVGVCSEYDNLEDVITATVGRLERAEAESVRYISDATDDHVFSYPGDIKLEDLDDIVCYIIVYYL